MDIEWILWDEIRRKQYHLKGSVGFLKYLFTVALERKPHNIIKLNPSLKQTTSEQEMNPHCRNHTHMTQQRLLKVCLGLYCYLLV